ILILLVAGAWPVAGHASDCATTLRVAAHGVWREPNTHQQENGRDQQLLTRVAARLNWCLTWEERDTNITRRLTMIREGDVDVLIGASRTQER
ncbi:hypothetical protein ABTL78_19565, partial [Acinetobacter baumannii]